VDVAIDWLIDKGKGVLNFLGGGGSQGSPNKIGEEVDWEIEGESHRLWIEDRGGTPVVMMASEAAPVEAQLAKYSTEAEKQDSKKARSHLKQAEKKNAALNTLVDKLVRAQEKAGGAGGSPSSTSKLEKDIEDAQTDLVEVLKQIEEGLGLDGGTFGSVTNPIPLDWPKPRLASYRTFLFGPRADGVTLLQKDLQAARSETSPRKQKAILEPLLNRKWDPDREPIVAYKPTEVQKLPNGNPIGVADEWQVSVGMKIAMDKTAGTGGGDRLNRRLKPYGFSPTDEDLEADHVVERQMGGADEIANLWPLKSELNGRGGGTLRGMKFPSNGQRFVAHLNHTSKADLTMNEVKDAVTRTKKPVHFRIVSTLE